MSQTFKVVLLGEGRVGKTSLASRFIRDEFSPEEPSTVQASMYTKKKLDVAGKAVELSVWDTAGQERFHALGPIYYRNSNGALLVYDITDPDSFDKVKMWIKELRKVVGDDISIAIAGNKGDMEKNRAVPVAKAEQYAQTQNAVHMTTSAKTCLNVREIFTALAEKIVKQAKADDLVKARGPVAGGGSRRGVKIDTSEGGPPAKTTVTIDGNGHVGCEKGPGKKKKCDC
jgi:Ras-related protein Rab-21